MGDWEVWWYSMGRLEGVDVARETRRCWVWVMGGECVVMVVSGE